MIHGQIGQSLAVKAKLLLVHLSDKLGVGHTVGAYSGVDTLNPKSAELYFLLLTVAVSVGKTFLKGVFGNGIDVAAGEEITFSLF